MNEHFVLFAYRFFQVAGRHKPNGICLVNWTAHQKRLDDDERLQRKKQEMGKDDKEQVKKKQRDPKEISYLRFNANLDLVDWGMYRMMFCVTFQSLRSSELLFVPSEWYDNVEFPFVQYSTMESGVLSLILLMGIIDRTRACITHSVCMKRMVKLVWSTRN